MYHSISPHKNKSRGQLYRRLPPNLKQNYQRTMQHQDLTSAVGCIITFFAGILALVTKTDVAITVTILAGATTSLLNIKNLLNKKK
jgi:hypothetical protein